MSEHKYQNNFQLILQLIIYKANLFIQKFFSLLKFNHYIDFEVLINFDGLKLRFFHYFDQKKENFMSLSNIYFQNIIIIFIFSMFFQFTKKEYLNKHFFEKFFYYFRDHSNFLKHDLDCK